MIEKNNNMGTVNISLDVVATIAGGAAIECYEESYVRGVEIKHQGFVLWKPTGEKDWKMVIMIFCVKKIIQKE